MATHTKDTVYVMAINNGVKLAIEVEDFNGKRTVNFVLQTVKGDVPVDAHQAQVIVAMKP